MTRFRFLAVLLAVVALSFWVAPAPPREVHVVAGQSNAMGIMGRGAQYPSDAAGVDKTIPFFYDSPGTGSSDGKWTTLGPQTGLSKEGYFGPEITFARSLKSNGEDPAVFKYSIPSSSLAETWKGPGEGGAYDDLCRSLEEALPLLEKEDGRRVKVASFTWIQGESDAETDEMAANYEERLAILVHDFRERFGGPKLPVILGMDEQHPWVKERPLVVEAQKRLVAADRNMAFLSMHGLPKFDTSHLTSSGLAKHGVRLHEVYRALPQTTAEAPTGTPPSVPQAKY